MTRILRSRAFDKHGYKHYEEKDRYMSKNRLIWKYLGVYNNLRRFI